MSEVDGSKRSPHGKSEDSGDDLEFLMSHYVDRMAAGEKLDPDAILAEHPECGEELLEYLEGFLNLGSEVTSPCPLGSFGDYELLRQVGRGGMGVVYEAWEGSLDRRVALKVLPAGVSADSRAVTRFIREARVAAKLQHRNVVPVFAMGVHGETPYYAMLTGQSPRRFLLS